MAFWTKVNRLLEGADIIVLVADARVPEQSMNKEIEKKIQKLNKKFILVFNKADLISPNERGIIKKRHRSALLVSAKGHVNTQALLRRINAAAKGEEAVVGVVGYPNTGKSSIINAIKGRKSAPVSPVSGFTKGLQIIRVSKKIKLIDSPGVIPFAEKDEFMHAFMSVKNPEQVKDPEDAAMRLIEVLKGRVENFYGVEAFDAEDALQKIALNIRALKKGAQPDTKRAAVDVLRRWQRGKIR